MGAILKQAVAQWPWTLADMLSDLGDIDAKRIRWKPFPGTAKLKDAIRINEKKEGKPVELVDGVLVEKAMGYPEAILATYISRKIGDFVDQHNLGIVAGADGMMELFPGLLRIPDVSYLSWKRVKGKVPTEAAPAIAPDLAVEVISSGNTKKEMNRTCREYFKHGAKAVWMVYPESRTVTIYSNPKQCVTLSENDVISGETVLPGFTLGVRKLFGELDRTQLG